MPKSAQRLVVPACLVVVILGTWYLFSMRGPAPAPFPGTLYLTLPDKVTNKPSTHTLTAATLTPTRFFTPEWTSTHGAALTPDGLTMAYVGEYGENQIPQIFFTKTDRTAMGQISRDANRVKKNLVWNAQGTRLAYAARAEASSEDTLSSYRVFVTTLTGSTTSLTGGVPQFFSPDGTSLFVMQKGGLRTVPSTTGTPPSSVPNARISSSTQLSPATKVVLSPDHRRLAWTLPEQGIVQIFAVTSWTPFTLALEKEISVKALEPVFSSDGTSLALLDIARSTTRLMVYDLSTYASHQVFNMGTYTRDALGLSAWR